MTLSAEPLLPAATAPRIWALLGDKLGDNAQVEAIAAALGWPCERKRLRFRAEFETGKPRFGPSLHHLDAEASDPLEPPWPEAVLTVGRRPSMAALWLRAQSAGRTRVILVGRPKGRIADFDLVISTPQYGVPPGDNVLQLAMPLMRVGEEVLERARARWSDALDALPRPLTAVLIGGTTGPYRFDAAAAGNLLAAVEEAIGADGGSAYYCTSRRTPTAFAAAMQAGKRETDPLYRWTEKAEDNPYHGLLALADRFVVTGDSLSMMVEAARSGRPMAVYDPPKHRFGMARLVHEIGRRAHAAKGEGGMAGLLDRLVRSGRFGYPRDIEALHRALYDAGAARPLAAGFAAPVDAGLDELPRVVARIRGLLSREPGAP